MLRSGLIGRDILASRSPWLHEQEARELGLELKYELFDFTALGLTETALGPMLQRLAGEGFCGVNITHPYKQTVMPLLDAIDDGASLVGAVNTVAMRHGKLVGYNTDMTGFRDSFVRGLSGVSLKRVLQIGAGGAGAAVSGALLSLGVQRLEIADVRPDRAEALVERLRLRFTDAQLAAIDAAAIDTSAIDGVVNATPIGMIAHPGSPLDPGQLKPEMWVVDIVYFPLETELLRQARNLGCRVLDGSGMVVAQAAVAFEIMTGHAADHERMARSFHRMPSVTTD